MKSYENCPANFHFFTTFSLSAFTQENSVRTKFLSAIYYPQAYRIDPDHTKRKHLVKVINEGTNLGTLIRYETYLKADLVTISPNVLQMLQSYFFKVFEKQKVFENISFPSS